MKKLKTKIILAEDIKDAREKLYFGNDVKEIVRFKRLSGKMNEGTYFFRFKFTYLEGRNHKKCDNCRQIVIGNSAYYNAKYVCLDCFGKLKRGNKIW